MILKTIMRILWPEICPFCGKINREGICLACRSKLNALLIQQPKCMKCGKPIRSNEQEYCYDCRKKKHYFDRGLALWVHKEPVNTSIYQFKYHNLRMFGRYYAEEILKSYENLIKEWEIDLIIPIPLHPKRKRKRGYNQAEILAKEIGKAMRIPVNGKIVKRVRYTEPQKKMDHKNRERNLKGAFCVREDLKKIYRVLLVDDIYTTGNTIDEVARVLRLAGVNKIYFLTISIGEGL